MRVKGEIIMNMSFLKQFNQIGASQSSAQEGINDRIYELVSKEIDFNEGFNFSEGSSPAKSKIRLVKRPAVLAAAV